ncbi:MAG: hypothetical protein JOZ78_05200 [Chroococcidiopsidaceae cyanobacterium CP_BM_ER_R8_30]|nr:hypothetical protein [Chroococcidiopsidaceae cyanobacterium CP_BM_ER_R8_30]
MQEISLVCTLDGAEYKEYEVLSNDQTLGVISWNGERDPSAGNWYTTASDGVPRYFHTQVEVIDFLKGNVNYSSEIAAKLKAEAHKLMDIAEEIEATGDNI